VATAIATDLPISLPARSYGERQLITALQELLPEHSVVMNYRHPKLVHSVSSRAMELDIYYPELNLAFEYQGGGHFHAYHKGSFRQQLRRDKEKGEACKRQNITLVSVPFWWQGDITSLAATILQHRKDIPLATCTHSNNPLRGLVDYSLNSQAVRNDLGANSESGIPQLPFQKSREIVQLNPAAVFIRMHTYNENIEPIHLYDASIHADSHSSKELTSVFVFSLRIMSRLYGGTRAIWNGNEFVVQRKTNARHFPTIQPPYWFQQQLPSSMFLDGELVIDDVSLWPPSDTSTEAHDLWWSTVKFMVFDSPDHAVKDMPYMNRHQCIKDKVGQQTHVKVVEVTVCDATSTMASFLDHSVAEGAQGILFHDPVAPYLPGFPILWKKKVR
jgi:hypothetical protein